jgi:hypothetical protein
MTTFIFGLSWVCVVLVIERAMLYGRAHASGGREYSYRFHALRDELQIMAVQERLETTSLTYDFLMQSLNLALRNAGTMKLREMLTLAQRVKENVEAAQFDQLRADIERHDVQVRELTGRIFYTFAEILIANDWLVSAGVKTYKIVMTSWGIVRPVLQLANQAATAIMRVLAPTKVKAVKHALQYQRWASHFGAC